MKERPILFNGEMVREVLDGSKTQTRRAVKPQPNGKVIREGGMWKDVFRGAGALWDCRYPRCPYGVPGDRLWVRETWKTLRTLDNRKPSELDAPALVFYPADNATNFNDRKYRTDMYHSIIGKGRPSIHMPRQASRITLEITTVRVERLQDITEADAKAEGVGIGRAIGYGHIGVKTHREGFINLWDSINLYPRGYCADRSWDANPWVWVVEFKRVEGGAK